jgi:hypothetical protein
MQSQLEVAGTRQDTVATPRYKVWQICLVGAIISVGMNQAVMYMPHLLQVLLLMAWKIVMHMLHLLRVLLVRKLVAWNVVGVRFAGIHANTTNATYW